MRVALVERHGLAAAASGRNAGLVVGPFPPALDRIGRRSVELWLALHHSTGGAFTLDRLPHGYLVVAEDAEALDGAMATPGAERLDAAAVRTLEPQLAPDLAGGVLVTGDARRIDPAG